MSADAFPAAIRRALDAYDVPGLPAGFADRVVVRALAAPLSGAPWRRRGRWRRSGGAAAGLIFATLAAATAAAMGWFGEPVRIPVISAIVERLAPAERVATVAPARPQQPVAPALPVEPVVVPEPVAPAPAVSAAPRPTEAAPRVVAPALPVSAPAPHVPEFLRETRRDMPVDRAPERLARPSQETLVPAASPIEPPLRSVVEPERLSRTPVAEPVVPRETRPAERTRIVPPPRPERVRPAPREQRPARERPVPRRM